MEKVIAHFGVETGNGWFSLTIFAGSDADGYVAEYFGTTPKCLPGARSELGSGRMVNAEVSWLLAACLNEFVRIDGPIERVLHHPLTRAI